MLRQIRAWLTAAGCLLAAAVSAQKPSDVAAFTAKYPDEDGVFLQMREDAAVKIENDSVKVYSHNYSQLLMLKDNTAPYAEKKLAYSSFIEITELKPITLAASGDKYKQVQTENIKDVYDMDGMVFYDDTRYKSFIFPSLVKGNIAELDYTEKYNEPRFLSPYFFTSYCPVKSSVYTITFPENVKVSYKLMGPDRDKIKFSKSTSKGNTTYTFEATDLNKWEYESNAPPASVTNPHVIIFIEEATIKGVKHTYLKDVASLYDWYYSLTKNVNAKDDKALADVVAKITKDAKTDRDKVKAIFYWVQDNIKYIAFEAGYEGFVPREAAAICNKKYGDCKDMASIISKMCRMAGVDAYMVWLGSRDIAYKYDEVPSPLCDNHMIAAWKDNGKWVFLDATGQYLGYGYPTDMIQDKEAIIGIGKDQYELLTVPVVPKEMNTTVTKADISLDGNLLKGNAVTSYAGFPKFYKIFSLRSTPESKWNELMKSLLETGNNKSEVTDYKISGQDDRDDTLQFTYAFKVPDYIKKIDNEYYVNMNLNKTWAEAWIDTTHRKLPVERDFLYETSDEVHLTVPDGYSVDYLPDDASWNKGNFGFSIHYEHKGNSVVVYKNIWQNELELSKAEFPAWNDMIKQINKAYKETIVLKQNI